MCSNSLQPFNNIIENDIKNEKIYNINEKGFLTGRDKPQHGILRKGRRNECLVQYNLGNLVILIEFIFLGETKYSLFIKFLVLSDHINNIIHPENNDEARLAYSKNTWTNVVFGRVWLEYF